MAADYIFSGNLAELEIMDASSGLPGDEISLKEKAERCFLRLAKCTVVKCDGGGKDGKHECDG